MERYRMIESPAGPLCVVADEGKIVKLIFGADHPAGSEPGGTQLLLEAENQLAEYFAGKRRAFTLPLHPCGTDFQMRVWAALEAIPYGETRSYRSTAETAGSPKAYRAAGGACHNNPLPILIPCHRVVGTDGGLTGYGGGIRVKNMLLELERAHKAEGRDAYNG